MLLHCIKKLPLLAGVCGGFLCILSACEQQLIVHSSVKEIVSFSLETGDSTSLDSSQVSVVISNDSVLITVPFNTDLTRLIPNISIKGVRISPQSGVEQNFSSPVIYTVTAADSSKAAYVVMIKTALGKPIVYVGGGDNNFYALDAQTGALQWKYEGGASFAYSRAAYLKGVIYVGGIDSYLYAFDAYSGKVKWQYRAGSTGIESNVTIANGIVYFGSNDHHFYALDAVTGQLKWNFPTGANVSTNPVVSDGIVYFGSSDSRLYAIDALTGELKWSYPLGNMINRAGVSLANGILFAGSRDGYLYAINAATGSLKWRFYAGGASLEESCPAVSDSIVYIGGWYTVPSFNQKGSLYAVNINTGQLIWEKLANTGFGSSPLISDGRVYITADDGNLYALDAITGTILWRRLIYANSASPAVYDGTVYVGGGGTSHIYAFDAISGVTKWEFPLRSLMISTPIIIVQGS